MVKFRGGIIMGAGNVCVFGEVDTLVFVDYDNYRSHEDYELRDWDQERMDYEDSLDYFLSSFSRRFKSFYNVSGKWLSNDELILMENDLYYLVVEDNNWSAAIKLIAKERDYYDSGNIENLQRRHYQSYKKGLMECWFEQFDSIGIYTGAWTSGSISREEYYGEKIGA